MSNSATITTRAKTCQDCGEEFEATTIDVLGVRITPTRCDRCVDEAWQRNQRSVAAAQDQLAPKLSPDDRFCELAQKAGFKRYLRFDPEQLPAKGREIWERVTTELVAEGLTFTGPTSQGKTFVAVDVCRRLAREGANVRLVDGILFGMEVGQVDSERRERAVKAAVAADWLLFDDLGKVAKTPRVTEALFAIAKLREDNEAPTIWTSNATFSDLREQLPGEYCEPFLERLRRTTRNYIFD